MSEDKAKMAESGGPGRTRTCNQTVMSGSVQPRKPLMFNGQGVDAKGWRAFFATDTPLPDTLHPSTASYRHPYEKEAR